RSGMVRFAITDSGPGLRAEDTERIFEEFEQADGTSTRAHAGAGLGLAISKRLVTSMNGTVWVESTSGSGSESAFAVQVVWAKGGPQMRGPVLVGRCALIVSKNAAEARAIALTIRSHGGEAEIATTVAQAADMAAGCTTLVVDAAIEQPDGRLLKRLRQA